MALKTPEQFEESMKGRKLNIFMNGERINDIFDNPNTRTVIEANKASYKWALDPESAETMSTISPLIGERINRYTHVCQSKEDLLAKANAGCFTAEQLGTCIYRCVGLDCFHSAWATTWEMDQKLGTDYHPRFLEYLKWVQKNDLSVAGALTEPRGPRDKKLKDWDSPNLALRVVEKRSDGIVVKGYKINISGAYASHEIMVLPQGTRRPGEDDYAVAFAVPSDAEGITYICQYNAFSAERLLTDDIYELGNPLFGQRETSAIVFDNVFIPWDRVFHCGEVEYSGNFVARFARTHRMTCGGTCKVGFMSNILGACRLLQEYKGMMKAPHINDQMAQLVILRETARACGLAAANLGAEEPPGSGVYMPDEMMGNVSKLNVCSAFWKAMELAGDIGGGLVVTMPSLRELKNTEVKGFVEECYGFGTEAGAERIMKVTKLLQNWTAGLHGVGTWHGAGPPQAQKIMISRIANYDSEKDLVKKKMNFD